MSFDITDKDIAFYDKISPVFSSPIGGGKDGGKKKYQIPTPTLCPDCRQQRRLAFRNERSLYKRKCDKTGKNIVSTYSPDKPYKVYDQKERWSDSRNPLEYGKDFDFSRSFLQQFDELYKKVPKSSIIIDDQSENSDYSPYLLAGKNCYLCISGTDLEDCYYCFFTKYSNNCIDCNTSSNCESCYECLDCIDCYMLFYAQNSQNCRHSYFVYDCQNCEFCFGCVGLRNKRYYIYNEACTKGEYEKFISAITFSTDTI